MSRAVAVFLSAIILTQPSTQAAPEDLEDARAESLLKTADLKYDVREFDEAIDLYRGIIDRYPKSRFRFSARLRLGKHFVEKKDYDKAIGHLHECAESSPSVEEQTEARYLVGQSWFSQGKFEKAFSELRKVTADFPGTDYCNKAYHYIGMGHFKLKHYKRAIEAFRMVGTSVSEIDPNVRKVAPGKRLFIRVNDRDLTILSRQKKALPVELAATSGDREPVELHSRGLTGTDFIGSIKTELGEPRPGDGTLQVLGTDKVSVVYLDTHASEKQRNIRRTHEVAMADDARLDIVDGIFKARVPGVALGRSASIRVIDGDRDPSAAKDSVEVIVRAKREIKEEAGRIVTEEDLMTQARGEREKKYLILDEERVTLLEMPKADLEANDTAPGPEKETQSPRPSDTRPSAGPERAAGETGEDRPVHSGVFVGRVPVREGDPKKGDGVIHADINDTIEVEYLDQNRVTGDESESLKAEALLVKGSIPGPVPFGGPIQDAALRVRAELQISEALMNMGRIYKELGLKEQADAKFLEALKECAKVAREEGARDRELLEKTQYLLWQIYFSKGDNQAAARVCIGLLRNFPNSDFADDALMMMGNVAKGKEDYTRAISFYRLLLSSAHGSAGQEPATASGNSGQSMGSPLAPDAQYALAECYEEMGAANASYLEKALVEYKRCAEVYPSSMFAPSSITKIGNFYYKTKDYVRALEVYGRAIQDYDDSNFLDLLLLNYGKCLVMMKDYVTAEARFQAVISDHPESAYVKKAEKYRNYCRKKIRAMQKSSG